MDPSKLDLHFLQEAQDHSALAPSSATSLFETYLEWSSNFLIPENEEEHDIGSVSYHNHTTPEIVHPRIPTAGPYDHQIEHHSITNQSSNYPFLEDFSASTDASGFRSSVELMGTSMHEVNDMDALIPSGFSQTSLQGAKNITYESTKRKILSSFLLGNSGPDGKKSCLSTSQHSRIRKERLSDKVSALQQLVAPFGKTDTASVLTEAFGYIKFLLEQIQISDNGEEENEQNLKSKGLCLMPIASVWLPTDLREN